MKTKKKKPRTGKAAKRHPEPGRPIKLTAEMADKIVTLSTSLAIDAAICRAVRITPATFCEWKNKAAEGRQPYKELFERIDEAQAIEEIDLMTKISGDPDWRAKAWALERRRQGYENRQKMEHTGAGGKPLEAPTTVQPVTLIIQGGYTGDNPYLPPKAGK